MLAFYLDRLRIWRKNVLAYDQERIEKRATEKKIDKVKINKPDSMQAQELRHQPQPCKRLKCPLLVEKFTWSSLGSGTN